ncbi:MAG: hypothetical protein KAQ85_00515 [Thermodesulfovibrionia bacterium]|nr:hypothetical protein [Thermodesulfovibrionia bacterium]
MPDHQGKGIVTHSDGSTTNGDYQIIEGNRGKHMLYLIPTKLTKSTLLFKKTSFESVSHQFTISKLVWGGFTMKDTGAVIIYAYLDRHKNDVVA